jgi:hypothetical protein
MNIPRSDRKISCFWRDQTSFFVGGVQGPAFLEWKFVRVDGIVWWAKVEWFVGFHALLTLELTNQISFHCQGLVSA